MRLLAVLLAVLVGALPGLALDPATPLTGYGHDVWIEELPQASVHAVQQTRDGYLWLGTHEGLTRFDGTRFTTLGAREGLGTDSVWALHEDRGGRLWIGTLGGGLVCLDRGQVTRHTTREGLAHDSVRSLAEDPAGALYVGTNGGVDRLVAGRIEHVSGVPEGAVLALLAGPDGTVWAGTERRGLARIRGLEVQGVLTRASGLPSDAIRDLALDREGALWIATYGGGLVRRRDGEQRVWTTRDGLPGDLVYALHLDPRGELWVGTEGSGLARFRSGAFERFSTREGLSHDLVRSFASDREGSLWIGTNGGLTRLRDTRFANLGPLQGLANPNVRVVTEAPDGSIWVGTDGGGVVRMEAGQMQTFTTRQGLASDTVRALLVDREGATWVGTNRGLTRLRAGSATTWTTRDGLVSNTVYALAEDGAGGLFVATINDGGLQHLTGGTLSRVAGVTSGNVRALLRDRDGVLWIGTGGDGLFRLQGGQVRRFTQDDGLPSATVFALHQDREGRLWLATGGGGLAWRDGDRFRSVGSAQGLPADTLFSVLEDDAGQLWLSSNRGVIRIGREAALRGGPLEAVVYTRADGLGGTQCNGSSQPAAWRARDGRLWFATTGGASSIDPARVFANRLAPPAVIDRFLVDGQDVPPRDGVVLPAGAGSFELRFAGLSFLAPEKVRFRFRLAGIDADWVEGDSTRQVRYTRLPPGRYTFEVSARNEDGVASEVPARLSFELSPHWWQTGWARLGALLTLAAALWAGLRLRLAALARRNRELSQRVHERTAALSQALLEREEKNRQLELARAEAEQRSRALRAATDQLAARNAELDARIDELQASQRRADRIFSALAEALPGTVLDGKYRLDEGIGKGGFGAVFRGTHLGLDRPIAVKVFRPRPGNDSPEEVERFRREGISACRVQHPNAVSVLDSGVSAEGIAYLVMELLHGRSVTAEVQEVGPLPVRRAISIAASVADVLAAAHAAGIVHRDVKPDNVFLHQGPDGEVVKVVDFGIAKLVGETTDVDLTHTGGLIGTPSYTAPERLTGRAYDGRADVYSLGLTLYAMLAGRGPFHTDLGTPAYQMILQQLQAPPPPLRAQRPDVPEVLERALMRALAKDPAERPAAGEFAAELRGLLAMLPESAVPAGPSLLVAEPSLSSDDTLTTLTPRDERSA